MSRFDDAIMRVYGSAAVRDELTDDEAGAMLKWAEGEVARLDASGAGDSAFEAQVMVLMDLLKALNRFAGRQGQPSAQSVAPGSVAAQAAAIGYHADAGQIAAAATGDPTSTLAALIALLSRAVPDPSHPTGERP